MNINQLSEQLKDVPQGTLVGYAKNPNSVVPQFLALAEIQRRQQLQSPAQAPTGTVADDVLAQANPVPQQVAPQVDPRMLQAMQQQTQQLPENQPGVAQLPTGMPQGMASGGIVAFADGGSADDEDYQDYLDKAESAKRRSGLSEMMAGLKDRVAGISESLPQSYEKTKEAQGIASLHSAGSHPFSAIAMDEAKKLGIDPKYIMHMLHKETGNLSNPEGAVSKAGARGPMQLMPGTAKELGVDINDPEANTRGGVRYFAKMMDMFNNDPTLAMAAYNAGPGRVRQMLKAGHGIESLPRETQGYVKMAKGGIAHFAKGSQDEPIKASDYYESSNADDQMFAMPTSKSISAAQSLAPGESIVLDASAVPVDQINPFISTAEEIRREREATIAEHANDTNMALLQAGLGMMAGTSPYAFANIGQGGVQGIAAYNATQKQKALELAGLRKSQISALEGQHMYDFRQQQLKDQADIKNRQLSSLEKNREERIRIAEEKLAGAADVAANIKQAKIDELTTKTLAAAAHNPQYKYYTKMLENNPPDSPEYQQAVEALQTIENAYLTNAGIKNAKPISIPQLAPKPEEPSVWENIRRGLGIMGGAKPSVTPTPVPSGRFQFDAKGNQIQ